MKTALQNTPNSLVASAETVVSYYQNTGGSRERMHEEIFDVLNNSVPDVEDADPSIRRINSLHAGNQSALAGVVQSLRDMRSDIERGMFHVLLDSVWHGRSTSAQLDAHEGTYDNPSIVEESQDDPSRCVQCSEK